MSVPTDEELIARCARGDRRAMDLLVTRYHGKLLDFAFRNLNDRETAADIAQMTFIKVMQAAGTYRMQSSFRTWLYTVALNLVRDEYRRRGRRNESLASELGDTEEPETTSASGSPTEEAGLAQVGYAAVWKAVDALDDSKRAAITLRFRHELTYDEIAEVMDEPAGTIKSWVHYALKALRRSLEPMKCEE